MDGDGPQILGTADIDYSIGEKLQKDRNGTQRAVVDNPWLLRGEFIIDISGLIKYILGIKSSQSKDITLNSAIFKMVAFHRRLPSRVASYK